MLFNTNYFIGFIYLATEFQSSSANANKYAATCDGVFCRIIDDSSKEIQALRAIVEDGACVPEFGQEADRICNTALERFAQDAPLPDDDKQNEMLYDKKIDDLEKVIDAPLHVIYLKQLALIRENAIKAFKSSLTTEGSEFEAMMKADELFRREAEDSTRQSPDWDYSKETQNLKAALTEIASRSRKLIDAKSQYNKQYNNALSYLQMQQQQLTAIQQQVQGSSSPWNIGLAYRVPDSNFNINCNYQQGRGSVQISCVPDEAISLLGPNGFVNGVTAGNLGISVNLNF